MSDTRVLIISHVDEAKEAYAQALTSLDVAHDVAFSFNEALRLAMDTKYNGVLIDILTLVRSSQEEKLIAYDFINLYPTIRVKWDKRNRQMNLGLLEQSFSIDPDAAMRLFIEERCATFHGRPLRKHQRANVCLSALLSRTEKAPEEASTKTFTVNVSEGGAFLHTTEVYRRGEKVWVAIRELCDPSPIRAAVCWQIEWGAASRSIPGIGVEFETLSERQQEELQLLIKSAKRTGRIPAD